MEKHLEPGMPWTGLPVRAPLMRPAEVALATGLGRSTIYAMIAQGQFPAFIKIGPRASALPVDWLEAFLTYRASQCE